MISVKKILIVFGTRPETIKMAPLILAFRNHPLFNAIVCVTGQHKEMLVSALEIFSITPDENLEIMTPGQDLFDITTRVISSLKNVINKHSPDLILVHGDTTTALSAALAGFYSQVSVGHVEAGLRTHEIYEPYPEELNRQIISKIAKWHFCPTQESVNNLLIENIPNKNIYNVGNTVIDSLKFVIQRINKDSVKKKFIIKHLNTQVKFNWQEKKFILITGHRRENFGFGFEEITNAIYESASNNPEIEFVYPVHPNPVVKEVVNKKLSNLKNVHLIKPLDYEPFIYFLKHCYFVLTDSGGIQEEAPSLRKPVLVMREKTERPEGVKAGSVKLVGTSRKLIINSIQELINDNEVYMKMSKAINPYGDGLAAKRIVKILSNSS